ncbi:hypothetical protein RintRC_5982 [Richelia intracellularis]|nr:hypothetical protein RintRC_5982 [Richelia intracellularis]
MGIMFSLPFTTNIAQGKEAYQKPNQKKENLKINSKLNLVQQTENFPPSTINKLEQNGNATTLGIKYKQPQTIVTRDTKISTSAGDIQKQSNLLTYLLT